MVNTVLLEIEKKLDKRFNIIRLLRFYQSTVSFCRDQEISTIRDSCAYTCIETTELFPANYLYTVIRHITIKLMPFLRRSFFFCQSHEYTSNVADLMTRDKSHENF